MGKRISRDAIDTFYDYGLYLPTRTLYLGSEVVGEDEESGVDALLAERAIKAITILETQSKEPITIILNNVGGSVEHGMAIYSAIKHCKSHVTIKVFGQASSMGSVIFQAADERVMCPYSVQMIHIGSMHVDGHAKDVYRQVEEAKRVDKVIEEIYLTKIREKNENFNSARLREMLAHDTFLTAEKSLSLGLCDRVLGDDEEEEKGG